MDTKTYPITVFYDEIYDSFLLEKKRFNYFNTVVRFPNPHLLILKIMIHVFHLEDKVRFVPCSSFELKQIVIYCEEEKKSFYEMLLYLHQVYGEKDTHKSKCNKEKVKQRIICTEKLNSIEFLKNKNIGANVESTYFTIFDLLNEFQEVYEYFVFEFTPCFEKYTKLFFLNTNWNFLKRYIKLKKHKEYTAQKFKNVSLSTMLKKFIKLLISFQLTYYDDLEPTSNFDLDMNSNLMNSKIITHLIYYAYAYSLLCVPVKLFPWDITSDEWNKKIFKDGNVNMISNTVAKEKLTFASSLFNIPEKKGYIETTDFNIASLIEATETKTRPSTSKIINTKINNDITLKMPMDVQNNFSSSYFVNQNEYLLFKFTGYNSFKQFYDTCFIYLTILKEYYLFNKRIEVVQNLFPRLASYLVILDCHFSRLQKESNSLHNSPYHVSP